MPEVTLIDPETGMIRQVVDVPEADVHLQNRRYDAGEMIVDNSIVIIAGRADARTQYWRNNKIIARPALVDVAALRLDLEEVFVVKRVPVGTEVTMIMGSEVRLFTVDDHKIEIVSRQPASFELIVKPPFPWQRQQIAVTVSAPPLGSSPRASAGLRPTALGTPE